eukprot:TRINITY_DN3828_c1_g1_i4.p1 TRINITY_DN3828_c1_g1~~TRINITY_DN3828_c1_g1_i4.p1  ORF type:complete len:132 (+),score=15.94 TRINITY_DN3828_c1_g1_i4:1939-2334(+)
MLSFYPFSFVFLIFGVLFSVWQLSSNLFDSKTENSLSGSFTCLWLTPSFCPFLLFFYTHIYITKTPVSPLLPPLLLLPPAYLDRLLPKEILSMLPLFSRFLSIVLLTHCLKSMDASSLLSFFLSSLIHPLL